MPLAGQGIVEGEIIGDSLDMGLSGKVNLEQFELDAGTDTLMTDNASFKYYFGGIGYEKLFEKFHASVEPTLNNFEINGVFENPSPPPAELPFEKKGSIFFYLKTVIIYCYRINA